MLASCCVTGSQTKTSAASVPSYGAWTMTALCCIVLSSAIAGGRPPGHHAESSMSMGFCFYNNAGIAARAAQAAGARRVLILDWDVHHGNGAPCQHL